MKTVKMKTTKLQQWHLDHKGYEKFRIGNCIQVKGRDYIIYDVWIAKDQIHFGAELVGAVKLNNPPTYGYYCEWYKKYIIALTLISPSIGTGYTNLVRKADEERINVMHR